MTRLAPLAWLPLLGALLLLGGCLRVDESLVLDKDLGGTVETTWTLDSAARLDLLRRFANLFGRDAALEPAPFANPFHPRWLETLAAGEKDVQVTAHETVREDAGPGGRGRREIVVQAKTHFGSLGSAVRAGAFFDDALFVDARPDGVLRLRIVPVWAKALDPGAEVAGRPARQVLDALGPALRERHWRRKVTVPTLVLETNGRVLDDGRTVVWEADFGDAKTPADLSFYVLFPTPPDSDASPCRLRPDADALLRRAVERPPGVGPTDPP